ncbi:MAG: response regulator [Deltaproteobacteria bacterium]|nr:response regulator [Deltaproteobacteria bacterium]
MATSPQRILVAEDDKDSRTLIKRYLEGKGYAVVAVTNGDEALAALSNEVFDLAVLDHMMPGLTGLEVLAKVRAAGNTMPIIMATALANPDQIVKGLEQGADDYVTKPFSPSVLAARIALRLRQRPAAAARPITPGTTVEVVDGITATVEIPAVEVEVDGPPAATRERTAKLAGPLPMGARIGGRYQITGVISEGGYGTVYSARHLDLDQDVAVKVVRGRLQRSTVDQFRREAQLACRVRHQNAVRVLDFGVLPDGAPFLVMDLLEGPTLENVLQRSAPLPVERAITILQAVLAALAATHRQQLVHCDVKPSNIILRHIDGREVPTLCDFGIATDVKNAKDSATKGIAGSAAYIAPERIDKQRYDGRVDVYACGMILYRALTGGFPFDPGDLGGVMEWHLTGERRRPSEWRAELSPAIDSAVLRLLSRDPALRPTAEEAETMMASLVWEA